MQIEIPPGMWKKFADEVVGNMFCPLCNHHVYRGHRGHADDCPLSEKAQRRAAGMPEPPIDPRD